MLVPPIVTSPGSWSNAKAMMAPNVISSPCAKFVSPVVPKIIESPSAAIASSAEKTRPPTVSWSAWVSLPEEPARGSPIGKETAWSDVGGEADVELDLVGVAQAGLPRGACSRRSGRCKSCRARRPGPRGSGCRRRRSRRSRPRRSPRRRSRSTVTWTPGDGLRRRLAQVAQAPLDGDRLLVVVVLSNPGRRTPAAAVARLRGERGGEAGEEHESQGSDRGQP